VWTEVDTGEFPLVVISNGERTPYTTEVDLGNGESILVPKRLDIGGSIRSAESLTNVTNEQR